jgi:hypothetical protein
VLGTEHLIGLGIILISLVTLLVFVLIPRNRNMRNIRNISAFQQLRRATGLSVEEGKRLHISIGQSSPISSNAAAGFSGLAALERLAQSTLSSDRPPVATSGDPTFSILSQDTMRAAYRISGVIEQYDPDRGRLTGTTPLSYVAGLIPIVNDEQVSTHILAGNFGPEIALITDAAEQKNAYTLAVSDALPAQATLFATAQDVLIGEELFVLPAYLQAGPFHLASLRVQDILRWAFILCVVVGAILKLLGIINL